MNETYNPINCDDYDNLELACQKSWTLSLELKNGEQMKARAKKLFARKNVEYLSVILPNEERDLRLDHISSFSHPELGTVEISNSD